MMLRLFSIFIITFFCATAKIEFIQFPRSSVVTIGQPSLTLDCVAKSKSEGRLQYKWSFNGTAVDNKTDILSSHSLYIPNIQPSDIGWYQCSVTNEMDPKERAESPKAYVIRPFLENFQVYPESTIVRIGETVILTCTTGQGAPPPLVNWEKDGSIFKGGVQNIKVVPVKGQPMVSKTEMTLELTANDVVSGEFVCSSENNLTKVSYRSKAGVVQSAVLFREFNDEPDDMTVKLGSSAVLACDPPHSVPPAIVIWYKNNERLHTGTQDFTEKLDNWDLQYNKVRYEDSGEYFCVAFNNYTLPQSRTSKTAVLSVIGPPQIIEPPSSQNIIQKMTLKLVCQVEGQPIPIVNWYHNKNIITPTTRTFLRNSNQELWITNVNKGDDGTYSCHVKNNYGNQTAVAFVSVAVPPLILLPIGNIVAEENSTKVLNCQVYGDPHPLVFWAKDGLPLLTINSRLKVLDTGLKIINITHGDEGNYTCTAVNDAGNQSASGVLTVESYQLPMKPQNILDKAGPHFVTFPKNTVTQLGHPVTFVCDAVGDPKPRITWTFNDSVSLPSSVNESRNGHILHIRSMSWKEVGKYTCFAQNLRSIKNKTAYLFLQDRNFDLFEPELPSKILSIMGNTILAVDDRLELTCKTTGLPPPHIYWLHNGRRVSPTHDGRIFFPSQEKLVANIITRHDTGNYTCFASNSAYNVSQTVKVQIIGQPKAPHLKSLHAISSDSVILEWEPAQQEPYTNVTGYIVRYKRASEYKPRFTLYMDNITSSTTRLQVKGLKPAQTYVFTVTAQNRVGEGSPSEMQSVTTWQAAPSEPVRLQVVKTSPVSIYLSWWRPRELHGTIKKYQLVRNALNWTKDQIVEELINIDAPFVSHTVRGLHPFTTYVFKVRAANMQNGTELWGNFSSTLTISTEMRAPSSSPQNLTVQPLKGRIVYLTWQPPSKFYQNGPLKQYVVRYESVSPIEGCEDQDVHYYASDGHSANITGLLPGTEYIFQISLENEAGRGPPSDIVRVTTLPEAPTGSPQNIIAKSPSPKMIEVFWNPPLPDQQNSKISSYLLEIYKPNGEKISHIIYDEKGLSKHPKSVFHKEIIGLKPWTMYKVRVAAVTNQVKRGQGPFSNIKVIRTLETAPGPVFNLSYEVIGSFIQLDWHPPLQPNGNIRWYHIRFIMIGPANSTDSMDNSTTINSSTGDILQDKTKHSTATSSTSELVTSKLSTLLTNLLPHSRYNVSISASTSTGGLGSPTMLTITTGTPLQNSSLYKSTAHNSSWNVPTTSSTRTTPKILPTPSETSHTSMKSGSGVSVPRASVDSSLQDLPVIVAGSLTAGLVFIFLLGVLIYHCVKNKKKRQKEQNYMMFYAYEDIGGLHPDDPVRHNRLQQTQLTSPEVRKATSYGCKEDVPIIKTQDNNSDGPSTDRDMQKMDQNQDKAVSPGFVHPTFWPKELKTSFGVKHVGIQNLGFEEDSSGSITFGPPSPEDSPRLTAEEVYSRVDSKKKNRMRNESAAAIAVMKNNALPQRLPRYSNDTDCLIHNESEVVYDERTAL